MLKLSKTHGVIPPYAFDGTLRHDNGLSYIHFKDFEANESGNSANVMLSGRNGIDYVVLFEDEAQKDEPYYKKSRLQKMRKEVLLDLWAYHNGGYPHPTLTKAELIADLLTVTLEQYYRNHYDETSWHDPEADFTVHGYSQGDAIVVKDLTKLKLWDEESLCNIFYDSPLAGAVTIYGNENDELETIYLDEFLESEYEPWQPERKEALITAIMERYESEDYATALREYLTATLPNDYSEVRYVD